MLGRDAVISGLLCALLVATGTAGASPRLPDAATDAEPDVLIVGAGIAGLSAALESARAGLSVKVVDMWSIFGGHAVMSEGGVAIVDSPVQRARGVVDSPNLAYDDFVRWGGDVDREWVRDYVDHSSAEIHDWLTPMGVTFDELWQWPGNSVQRFHRTKGRGLGLVSPIYRECVKHPGITFEWNLKVTGLLVSRAQDVPAPRVTGVRATEMRTGRPRELRARSVILATGGFQSNLEMVREFWPRDLPFPDRLLAGSGVNSTGLGHDVAREAGATYHRMDHQWNYATGLPDPRYPDLNRGLNSANYGSIWVNAQGLRFTAEYGPPPEAFAALVLQKPATYWAIFDESAKRQFWVSGSDWGDFARIERLVFGNPALVSSADSLAGLAVKAGLPADTLASTVHRYNEMTDRGEDIDFHRFAPGRPITHPVLGPQPARRIETPPYYAVRYFPLTRKSMGGLRIDRSCRVIDKDQRPIPGLYAAGELTGLAGINGKAGLEGTFLGPSIFTGKAAARAVVRELKNSAAAIVVAATPPVTTARSKPAPAATPQCADCHDVPDLVKQQRRGFSHFEKVHRVALERTLDCAVCHAGMTLYDPSAHQIDRVAQIDTCATCHQ